MNKRIQILTKVAKKSKKTETFKGGKIKDVVKFLQKMKKEWASIADEMTSAKAKREELDGIIDVCDARTKEVQEQIARCHDILQCADYTGAKFVKLKKNKDTGDADTLYSMDGKSWGYSDDGRTLSFGKRKPVEDEACAEDADVSDASDQNNSEMDITLDEGVDVSIATELAKANKDR